MSGKWHIGHAALQRAGFSYWNVHAAGGGHYYEAPMIVNGERYQTDEYVTDVITDNALEFLNAQVGSDKPFSLNVHYTAPHAPWGPEEHPGRSSTTSIRTVPSTRCLRKTFTLTSLPGADSRHARRHAGESQDGAERYFAAVTEMDRNIGRMLDWLEGRTGCARAP